MLSGRVPADLLDTLTTVAAELDVPRSELLRRAVAAELDRLDHGEDPDARADTERLLAELDRFTTTTWRRPQVT